MADLNIQIKRRNGSVWDNLFPKTIAANVTESTTKRFVSDDEKSAWNAKQAALGFTPENSANKNAASGYAGLDADSKLSASQLPAIAITDTFVVATEIAMLALTAQIGDVAVRTDLSKSFILKETGADTLAHWSELLAPSNAVASVNNQTGVVSLDTDDISEGTSNLYYTDTRVNNNSYVSAGYSHSSAAHAPSGAQANADITKAEIEAKLTGAITSHSHAVTGFTVSAVEPTTPSNGDFWYEIPA